MQASESIHRPRSCIPPPTHASTHWQRTQKVKHSQGAAGHSPALGSAGPMESPGRSRGRQLGQSVVSAGKAQGTLGTTPCFRARLVKNEGPSSAHRALPPCGTQTQLLERTKPSPVNAGPPPPHPRHRLLKTHLFHHNTLRTWICRPSSEKKPTKMGPSKA